LVEVNFKTDQIISKRLPQ